MKTGIKNRAISLLLALVMLAGLVPAVGTQANAEGTTAVVTVTWYDGLTPVSGAAVTLGGVGPYYTDASGVASFACSAGTYRLTVTADSYASYSASVTITENMENQVSVLMNKTFDSVFSANTGLTFTGSEQALISATGLPAGATVSYTTSKDGGAGTTTSTIPVAKESGNYTVAIAASCAGYENYNNTFSTSIANGTLSVTVTAKELMYNGAEQELITITGLTGEETVAYKLDGISTGNVIPTAMEVGDYTVHVEVTTTKSGYDPFSVDVFPKITMNTDQIIYFANADGKPDTEDKKNGSVQTYDMTASGESYKAIFDPSMCVDGDPSKGPKDTNLEIKYNQATVKKADGTNDSDVITINADTGYVTWDKVPGIYCVTATVDGADPSKYSTDGTSLKAYIVLQNNGTETPLLKFKESDLKEKGGSLQFDDVGNSYYVEYIQNGNNLLPTIVPIKANDADNGALSYSVDVDWLTVGNDGTLSFVEGKDAEESCVITITKSAGTLDGGTGVGEQEVFAESSISYELRLMPSDEPIDDQSLKYAVPNADNKKPAYTVTSDATPVNGWYGKDVTVTSANGYKLSKTGKDGSYSKNPLTYTADDIDENNELKIYVKKNGDRSEKINVLVQNSDGEWVKAKIDKTAPTMHVTYSGAEWIKQVEQVVTFGISQAGFKAKIDVTDNASGVASIKWWFESSDNLSVEDLKYKDKDGSFKDDVPDKDNAIIEENSTAGKEFSVEIEIKAESSLLKQFKGTIKAVATDIAGNEQNEFEKVTVYTNSDPGTGIDSEDNIILVVDAKSPAISVVTVTPDKVTAVENTDYYAEDVKVSFAITESNFEKDDVVLTVKKDGAETTAPAITYDREPAVGRIPTETNPDIDKYNCSFDLSGDGEYTFSIYIKDKAGNEASCAYSRTLVIDKTNPVVNIKIDEDDFTNKEDAAKWYTSKDSFVYTISVKSLSFSKDGVKIDCMKDGASYTGTLGDWKYDKDADLWKADYTVGKKSGQQAEDYNGVYTIKVSATGLSGLENSAEDSVQRCIDTVPLAVSVKYDGSWTGGRYTAKRTGTITVKDVNFDTSKVPLADILKYCTAAAYVDESDLADKGITFGEWKTEGDTSTLTFSFDKEANYALNVDAKNAGKYIFADLAGNGPEVESYEREFIIDRTAPSAAEGMEAGTVKVEYDLSKVNQGKEGSLGQWLKDILANISFGYWNEDIKVTVTVYDEVAGTDGKDLLQYVFTRAETQGDVFVSSSNKALLSGSKTMKRSGKTFTSTISLPSDAAVGEQLDGTLNIEIKDLCGNKSSSNELTTRLVYDTVPPKVVKLTLNGITSNPGQKSYFSTQNINCVLTIEEANFFKDQITIEGNGGLQISDVNWSSKDADTHVATFKASSYDGECGLTIKGKDYAGNAMLDYASCEIIVDTKIDKPEITVNGDACDGKAYKTEAEIEVDFDDDNFDYGEVKVYRTRFEEKGVDVTNLLLKEPFTSTKGGGFYQFDDIEWIQENDGIYTVVATMKDLAGHTSQATSTFTVNRFGSIYSYSDYLTEIIKDGGKYLKRVEEDLVINEYNADKLIKDTTKVIITLDGKPIDNVKFEITPAVNEWVEHGESGWYEYTYVIDASNFEKDGLYKVYVVSEDAAGNKPETNNYAELVIQFYVDSTPPEIPSVTGLEKAIVNAESQTITFDAFDAIGLKKVTLYLDGNPEITVDKFEDGNNYSGTLTVNESDTTHTIRIVAEDFAGNTIDTEAEDFTSSYVMSDKLTVSTSLFVRFYANKALFWGSIGGLAGGIAIAGFLIPILIKRKKKKEEEEDNILD